MSSRGNGKNGKRKKKVTIQKRRNGMELRPEWNAPNWAVRERERERQRSAKGKTMQIITKKKEKGRNI